MWFGPWKDGERNGYGAYFDITAHTIQSGKWIGNELIAGTSYICKEKAEPVLPARTRTVSKPFSYSGTVRYINLPTSSYMSYITEAINKWGKCRTGAITMYGAGVGVYGNSGYAYTGSTPSKLKKRIEEANSSNAEITDINITENGNYVIILGGSGYWTLGYPDAFLKKLEQYRTGDLRDDNILSACFNDRGEWVVITDKHYSYSNETIKNFILKAEELYEEVYYAYITKLRDDSLLQKRSILQKHSIQFGRGIEETHIQTQSHQVYRQWIVLDYRWRITKLLFYVITHFF